MKSDTHQPSGSRYVTPGMVGSMVGLCVGVVVLLLLSIALFDADRSLSINPRLEIIGVAIGLLPSSWWAGRSIAKQIGGPNGRIARTVLTTSVMVGCLTSIGSILGPRLGIKGSGLQQSYRLFDGIRFIILDSTVCALLATGIAFALTWPFHIWSKRRQRAAAP